jgi:hypothetical protein
MTLKFLVPGCAQNYSGPILANGTRTTAAALGQHQTLILYKEENLVNIW